MADVVKIEAGDVLVISGVTLPDEPEMLESYQVAADFLREQAGITCLIVAEHDVALARATQAEAGAFRRLFLNGSVVSSMPGADSGDGGE
jgi:hypothetical protein